MDPDRTVATLLQRYGRTWSQESGFAVTNTPSSLFRLLVLSMLLSARISNRIAVRAARALFSKRWTSARHMVEANWEDRARALNEAGYARYDERTSRMLGETSEYVLERWRGDLRGLREEAERTPARERALLKTCKGIGDVGADIFCREVQGAWTELSPFLDRRALQAATRLGLGDDAAMVGHLCPPERLPQLVAALVRIDLQKGYDDLA